MIRSIIQNELAQDCEKTIKSKNIFYDLILALVDAL